MLARRLPTVFASTVSTAAVSRRFASGKKDEDDDRWLEAVFDQHTKEMTNEERYAAKKQKEIMRSMMGKLRDEHQQEVKKVESKHTEEISSLKKRLSELEKSK
jgi:hypothetical protein